MTLCLRGAFCCLNSLFFFFVSQLCGSQIVGNGSEQQLQRELEDVLMDPPMEDQSSDRDHGEARTDGDGEEPVVLEASASSTINPVSMAGLQKPEMSLPVKPSQGG